MRWLRRNLFIAAVGLFTLTGAESVADPLQMMLADTTVNFVPQGEAFLLWDGASEFYASEMDLVQWRVRRPYPDPIWRDDKPFYPISELAGATAILDPRNLEINITLPPQVLETQRSSLASAPPPRPTAATGMYLDYDLSYVNSDAEDYFAAMLTPTFFAAGGVLNSRFIYRGLDDQLTDLDQREEIVRLDTTLSFDDPGKIRTYRAGDVFTAPGAWGSALRLGGLQVASNFSTRPSLITFPVPYLVGASATPSNVDLYVDGVLRNRQSVNSGQFRIDDVPAVTGAGELKMVVTDMLGQEQVITQDFYASAQMLKPGLSEYSYSLGKMRERFGYASFDYGELAFVGAHRQGIDENWTLGARLELSEVAQLIGGTSDWALGPGGIVSGGLGLSHSAVGVGGSWLLGYEWQSRAYRFRTQVTGSSEKMATLDPYLNEIPDKIQVAISAGLNRGIVGAISATFVHNSYWDRQSRNVMTLNYGTNVREFAVSTYATYVDAGFSDFVVGMSLTRGFGERQSTTTSASHSADETRVRFETQKSVPIGPGIGYRVGATLADRKQYDGSFVGQTEFGRYSISGYNYDGNSYMRAATRGSLAWLAGRPYAAREISRGFAVARVANIPNVRVYVENHEIGRSDSAGRILLPSLRPYQTNRIRIEADDLPLGAQVDKLELEVAPYFRSGSVVNFPVRVSRQAILYARQADGSPVPAGATVVIAGQEGWTIVGMDGLIYLEGMGGTTDLKVSWFGNACELAVPLPAGDEPLPNLGSMTCVSVVTDTEPAP